MSEPSTTPTTRDSRKSIFSKIKDKVTNKDKGVTLDSSPNKEANTPATSPNAEKTRTKSIFSLPKKNDIDKRFSVVPTRVPLDVQDYDNQTTTTTNNDVNAPRRSDADMYIPRRSDADLKCGSYKDSFRGSISEETSSPRPKAPRELQYNDEDARKIIAWNMRSWFLGKKFKEYTKTSPDLRDGRLRIQTIREIQSTETRYVRDLDVCVKCFLEPLRNHPKKIMKPEDIDSIFGTLEQVKQTNELLLTEINATMNDWPQVRIGNVFKKFAPVLKAYTSYINQFDKSAKLLEDWEKKSKSFNQFLEKAYQLPETGQQRLASFLVMPVQRIPRYRMLLQELQKRTPENHIDYAAIDVALNEVNKVALYVNESKRKEENNVIVFHVQDLLGSRFQILAHRHYIRRSCMAVKCDKIPHLKNGTTQFDVFLFNDMIMILPKGVVPQFNSTGDSVEGFQKSSLSQKEIVNQCIIIYLCFANLREREPTPDSTSNSSASSSSPASPPTSPAAGDFKLHLTGFIHTNSYKFEFTTASELELAEWEADILVNLSRIHKTFLRRGVDPTIEHIERTRLKLQKAVFVREGQRDQLISRKEQFDQKCKQLEDEMQNCEDQYSKLMTQINDIKKKLTEMRKKADDTGDNMIEIAASLEDDRSKLGETDEVIWSILNHDMNAFQEMFDDKPNVPVEQLDDIQNNKPAANTAPTKEKQQPSAQQDDEDQTWMALYLRFAQAKFPVSDILTPVDRDVPEEDVEIENTLYQLRAPPKWFDLEQEMICSKYRSDRISNNNRVMTHMNGWNVSSDEGDPIIVAQKYLNEDLYSDSREEHNRKIKEKELKKQREDEEKKILIEELKRKVEESKERRAGKSTAEIIDELKKTIQILQQENLELKEQLNKQNSQ
jgi:hypothetical protein